VGDQDEVVAFLSTPAAYASRIAASGAAASAPPAVDRIDTHISIVWLAAARVYKLKRAVRYDYVDFSTVELRRQACEAEVRINRRTAPSLYLGTVAVTRGADGALALGGSGPPVDWLVEMVRFDQATLFDRLAEQHRLDPGLMAPLGEAIVRLHRGARQRRDRGGRAGIEWVVEGNAAGFRDQGADTLDADMCDRLTAESRGALDRQGARLDDRRARGLVRECHGDLHLRNICIVDGAPTLFDAVEFNEDISCIDVLYDLAFLLMDLWRRDLKPHANRVFNAYLTQTNDLDGLSALPLFLSCRAAVRAKTSATTAKVQSDAAQASALRNAARQYLELARMLLHPPQPCLLAVGGPSGSGKSTLAGRIAPAIGATPGALVVRSDLVRKELLGVSPLTRLGDDAYTDEVSARVYGTVAERARTALDGGHAVVADAVFGRKEDREAIARVAADAGVPFVGIWLEGPREVFASRLDERVNDASDATREILKRQAASPAGPVVWHRLDASSDAAAVQGNAERIVEESLRHPSPER
jgi:aminoglycoside phosphotransferase family enzyme/predicted kinase